MLFNSWLQNLKSACGLGSGTRKFRLPLRHKPMASYRLALEALEDRFLPSTFTVLNTLDSGAGSFRAALTQVNADTNPGTDKIKFAISGTGPFLIQPLTALPAITHPVVIDGYTQAGAQPDTLAVGDNAVIMIQLDGKLAGQEDGLAISAGGSTVEGISITRFDVSIGLTGGGNDVIKGNFIDLTPAGLQDYAPYQGNNNASSGLVSVSGAGSNQIGGTSPAARNVVAGGVPGVAISGPNNSVQGNYLDSDLSGTKPQGGGIGISLFDATNTMIGGLKTGAGNVVLNQGIYSGAIGIYISGAVGGPGSTGTVIQGNNIGVDATGSVGFQATGLVIYRASNTVIGGTTDGSRNVITSMSIGYSAFDVFGYVSGLLIQGNYVGTDSTGLKSLGLPGDGIDVENATNVTIGGTVKGAGNLISGHFLNGFGGGYGISTGGSLSTVIQGNLIGTDATGTVALPNEAGGISSDDPGDLIGGTTRHAGNVISGNGGYGVKVSGNNTVVQANLIGTDLTGTVPLLNRPNGSGIQIGGNAIGALIGGTTMGAGNIISGNAYDGVDVFGNNSVVQGNLIGVDATGEIALPNGLTGVSLGGLGGLIGGTTAPARNVISGNGQNGVSAGFGAGNNLIEGNYIGTDKTGAHPLGNTSDGVLLQNYSSSNTIGGVATDAGNVIAHNGGDGVDDADEDLNYGLDSPILSNSIFGNTKLGIDVGDDGVTANTPGNHNYPVLNVALTHGGLTGVLGTLNGEPYTSYTVQFFTNPVADPSGYGQGQYYLGSTTVLTDATGNVLFKVQFKTLPGTVVTATATDPNGNTSEFSADIVTVDKAVAAQNDAYRIDLNTTLTVATPGVQANDLALGNTPTTSSVVVKPAHGKLMLAADGSFTYTPTAGYTGIDTFTYKDTVCGQSANALVTITVAPKTFVVANTADNGPGSLRQAILNANLATSAPPDTIQFAIPGTGPFLIQPATPLPAVSHPTIIDGYSQPGASPNTLAVGDNAVLLIQLDGTNAGGADGLQLTGGGSMVQGLDITGFYNGIHEFSDSGDVIQGNFIGTDVKGANPLGNFFSGIELDGLANTIGGATAPARNLISANEDGVFITGAGNLVEGNYMGTDATGTLLLLGNTYDGVQIVNYGPTNGGNIIGGATAGTRNLISGNGNAGVEDDSLGNNLIESNYIGTDVTGTLVLANTGGGVFLEDSTGGDTLGGTTAGARNIISGNGYVGVGDYGTGNNLIEGNYIGTDITGTRPLGNAGHGVEIYSSGVTLGGTTAGAGNLIASNAGDGVFIAGGSNLIQGNDIGTPALGNMGAGINIQGSFNTVGGTTPGASNFISFNSGDGVLIDTGTGNAIQQNSIFSNGGLGIDLINGGNNVQAAPVLTSAISSSGNISISGTLTSTANTTFTVELFSNPSGTSQGQTFLGFVTVTTDSTGLATFTASFAVALAPGQVITATATDPLGDTSEFSNGQIVI